MNSKFLLASSFNKTRFLSFGILNAFICASFTKLAIHLPLYKELYKVFAEIKWNLMKSFETIKCFKAWYIRAIWYFLKLFDFNNWCPGPDLNRYSQKAEGF